MEVFQSLCSVLFAHVGSEPTCLSSFWGMFGCRSLCKLTTCHRSLSHEKKWEREKLLDSKFCFAASACDNIMMSLKYLRMTNSTFSTNLVRLKLWTTDTRQHETWWHDWCEVWRPRHEAQYKDSATTTRHRNIQHPNPTPETNNDLIV